MIDLEDLYFDWMMTRINQDGVTEGVAYLCGLLHNCEFTRRVGNDINRAQDGMNLRRDFLHQFEEARFDPNVTNNLMEQECSWLEMLIPLAEQLDFLYEGGVEGRFVELISNLELDELAVHEPYRPVEIIESDQHLVGVITNTVNESRFNRYGHGGIFPLRKRGNPDQREVEIWDQQAAYFRERLEGVLWTSTD